MSQNAYAYSHRITVPANHPAGNPSTLVTARGGPKGHGGLSFPSHALFHAIEDIAAWQGPAAPCSDDAVVQLLAGMVDELEHYGNRGYGRLKAWINYHSDAVRKAGRSKGGREKGREGVGVAWLLEEGRRFRDLSLCYFEVAGQEHERERKDRRRGMMVGN
ncbi:uncharacterized protein EKO05_0011391 [Ascochyta rabiei]|uniref:Uncharacterized protein n=1 Tax=Didymella rabiei TaxID=5454 RepID=A0A163K9T1_DIDRA|nr:uncharacterized protein EKO05_0011391 [Ascochyta rabiei]KZM26868.1 hypothetical protein ST47_g1985 [Ascochyta rabiei]UPX21196.1 hypothetical protein EKO05_0011391 [Ascochyta rabiei]